METRANSAGIDTPEVLAQARALGRYRLPMSRRRLLASAATGVGAYAAGRIVLRPSIARAATVNAADYGAVGDGSHDDTNAINNAIRAVARSGGTVQLNAGVFMISSRAVRLPSYVGLRGVGANTVLRLANWSDSSVVVSASPSTSQPTTGASIFDLRIDGNKQNQSGSRYAIGISLWAANDCLISGVQVDNTLHTGIYIAGSGNTVTNSRVSGVGASGGNGESGIVFDSDGYNAPYGSSATGNQVENVLEHGIKVYPGGGGSTISGNRVTGAGNRGIYIQAATECYVSDNIVDATGETGILIGGGNFRSDGCVVSGNTVRNSRSHGVLVWGSSGVSVSDENWVEANRGSGVYFLNSPNGSIIGNHCVGNDGNGGVVLNGSSGSRVTGNSCIGNDVAGITLWDDGNPSADCVVNSNYCSDDGWGQQRYGILATDGTARLTVQGNNLTGNLVASQSVLGRIIGRGL